MPSDHVDESLLERDSDQDSDSIMVTLHGTPHQEDKVNERIGQDNHHQEDDETKAVPRSGGSGEGDKDTPIEEDDEELGSFIRIRSQGDGIFEQDEDDDDEEEFYDFAIPEVELRSPPSRKRKQEISFIDNELSDLIEVSEQDNEDEDQIFRVHEAAFRLNPELFKSRKRDRMPLYLLNPDDFAHDPKRQHQIRRAIITYRHHQDKKQQIIKLTDENKKLREHVQTLKSKVIELSRCGCKKNQNANVDVLDIEISTVPPRMYIRGSRPVLAVPYNRCSMSPNSFSKSSSDVVKTELESTSVRLPSVSPSNNKSVPTPPAQTVTTEVAKPLINITSSRLANLNSKTLSSANVVTHTLPKPPPSKVFNNGTSVSTMKGLQMSGANRIAITGASAKSAGFIPISLATTIKSEPGVSSNMIMNMANYSSATATATTPIPLTATVKNETASPATAAPVSRIVFAKKGNTSNAVQTASQLLFGTKTIPQVPQAPNNVITKRPAPTLHSPMTASQLAFANRKNVETTTTVMNPLTSINNKRISSQPGQIFKTASGQILKLVQSLPVPRKITSSAAAIAMASQWKPIAPKPAPSTDVNSVVSKQSTKEDIDEMWRRFDDEDEDEMAIIAAINGTSPPQRNRKQTMESRNKVSQPKVNTSSNAVLKSCGQVIELDKYQDIVFEEAD